MPNWRELEFDTQARSREGNESTARARAPAEVAMDAYHCECGDEDCLYAIWLTAKEYESVRAYATHFALAPNHENPESEQLVEEHERFTVVEMVCRDAAKLARKSDPRQWRDER